MYMYIYTRIHVYMYLDIMYTYIPCCTCTFPSMYILIQCRGLLFISSFPWSRFSRPTKTVINIYIKWSLDNWDNSRGTYITVCSYCSCSLNWFHKTSISSFLGNEQTEEGDAAAALGINNPERYVLKPQREGGGKILHSSYFLLS